MGALTGVVRSYCVTYAALVRRVRGDLAVRLSGPAVGELEETSRAQNLDAFVTRW